MYDDKDSEEVWVAFTKRPANQDGLMESLDEIAYIIAVKILGDELPDEGDESYQFGTAATAYLYPDIEYALDRMREEYPEEKLAPMRAQAAKEQAEREAWLASKTPEERAQMAAEFKAGMAKLREAIHGS